MKPSIVTAHREFAPPAFETPPAYGYLHLGGAVAPPSGPPLVRKDARRSAVLARLVPLAAELERVEAVRRVTVYCAVLVPPVGSARYDVAVLVETSSPGVLDAVRDTAQFAALHDALTVAASHVHLMAAHCLRSLGEVDRFRQGLFLFNHFTADDPELALALWEHLAGWYVARTGLDNSTLLGPVGPSDLVFVNHARWDKGLLRLAVEQFARPSFHRYVRANLRANKVIAMPVLYRLVTTR